MKGYVKVKFFYWHEGIGEEAIESMWAEPLDGNYKIANIPFYVESFALGDIVSASDKDGELFVEQLIQESGNSTVHVVFFDETKVLKVRKELKDMGCSSELSDRPFLIAVNVPEEVSYTNMVKPYLDNECALGLLDYGEACIATRQLNSLD